MLISGTRQFNCRKQFPFVLFRYQCLYLAPPCEKCFFCLHDYNSLHCGRPNWYALVKSCIIVSDVTWNMCGLRSLRNYEVRWKNGPSLSISKKAFRVRGLDPWPGALPLDPAVGSAPRPSSVPPAPNLPLHHYDCHQCHGRMLLLNNCVSPSSGLDSCITVQRRQTDRQTATLDTPLHTQHRAVCLLFYSLCEFVIELHEDVDYVISW